jgi:hypothetical protein
MNLVKWFRKNNTKVMAVVVIVLMIGFIGGTYFQQLAQSRTGRHKTVAFFADNRKITNYDLALARRELEILRMLRADDILRSIGAPLFRTQDLRALLLAELLFAERTVSPQLANRIKQIIRANSYRISDEQINNIYRRPMSADVYWLLLKKEAEHAGMRVPDTGAGNQLARIIPQIFPSATYSQIVVSIVNQRGIPEKEILAAFGKLMAVLNYAKVVCASENITSSQIMHNVSWEEERIDIEFVRFGSAVFAPAQDEPTQQQISEQFDRYRDVFAGTVSEQNPYGFGYKLPDRVQLEYLTLKLDELAKIVQAPTQQQAEEYYQKYRDQMFTEQVPLDPNDPNSMMIERTKTYAEVAGLITKALLRDKIDSRAETILQEAKTLTDAQFTDTEPANLTDEQYRQLTGDYQAAAEQLSEKYKIKIYTGKTGLLSIDDIRTDEYLGVLYLQSYAYNPIGLAQTVFAVDELALSELGPFDMPEPRLYQNIGPLKDISARITPDTPGKIMALVRVIDAKAGVEPESVDQTFSKNSIAFDQDPSGKAENTYFVREHVVEDLKKLAAMTTTKTKAEEFLDLAQKQGWQDALDEFNRLYGNKNEQDSNDSDRFTLQALNNLPRISSVEMGILAAQARGKPMARALLTERKKEGLLRDRLYSLVPKDPNTGDIEPLVVEFKPDMSYYCIKTVFVKHLNQAEYQRVKAMRLYKEDFVQSQSLAPVYFDPENILKRMKFRLATQDDETADVNTPAQINPNS